MITHISFTFQINVQIVLESQDFDDLLIGGRTFCRYYRVRFVTSDRIIFLQKCIFQNTLAIRSTIGLVRRRSIVTLHVLRWNLTFYDTLFEFTAFFVLSDVS